MIRLFSFLLFLVCAAIVSAGAPVAVMPYESVPNSLPVKLDDVSFSRIVGVETGPDEGGNKVLERLNSVERDYGVAVLFTASEERHRCRMCTAVEPEWAVLGQVWRQARAREMARKRPVDEGGARVVLATVDFEQGRRAFATMGFTTAPVLVFFPPTVGPRAKPGVFAKAEFSSGPLSAETMYAHIERHFGYPMPRFQRPLDWTRVALMSGLGLVVGTAVVLSIPHLGRILPLVQSRKVWAALFLIPIVMFTSGQMFNQIRNVPYVGQQPSREIAIFARGLQSQFGMETQIVAVLYAALSFGTIFLATKAPMIEDAQRRLVVTVVWVVVILLEYSFLLAIFRFKSPGYPFFVPPF